MAVIEISLGSTIGFTDGGAQPRRQTTFTTNAGFVERAPVVEAWESRELTEDESGMSLTRRFYMFGTKDPLDGKDAGPQRGDFLAEDDRFQVVSRDVSVHARGGGENDVLLITVTYQGPTNDDGVIDGSGGDEVIGSVSEGVGTSTGDEPEQPAAGGGGGGGGGDAVKSRLSLNIGSESVHLEKAISQESFGGADFGDIIGQTERGVEGIDVSAPLLTFTESHTFAQGAFNSEYLKTLMDLAFTVNDADFRGFPAGSVRFDGCNTEQAGKNWRLTFSFTVRRPELVPVTVVKTNGTTEALQIQKEGWDYIWIKTTRTVVDDLLGNPVEVSRTTGGAVARIYPRASFGGLRIGTAPFSGRPNVSDSAGIDRNLGFA